MRLGSYKCQLTEVSAAFAAYGTGDIDERHRHRYEVNNAYLDEIKSAGMRIAGINPELELVEIIEIADHPWFVGVQFHPEFKSRPIRSHPLFRELVAASKKAAEDK